MLPALRATGLESSHATFDELFPASGPFAEQPLLSWLVTLELAAIAGLPAARWALKALPDGGYGLAKALGLVLVAVPAWLAASLGLARFEPATIALSLTAWVAVAAILGWHRRAELRRFLRARWRLLLATEVIFLAFFLAAYALRLGNPDLFHPWRGGEKPMDLALLTAVARSAAMPPYDPWFAGDALNYYYFGHFLAAVPTKALGIAPPVAYNLAFPTFVALTALAAFSLGHQLACLTRDRVEAARRPALAGVAAVALVLLVGNLGSISTWTERLHAAGDSQLAGGALGAATRALDGLGRVLQGEADLPPFDYWKASRILEGSPSITEFPLFTTLYGDLHAHFMALPFAMLAASLAVGLMAALAGGARPVSQWPALVVFGVTLGVLNATNAWDLPTQTLLLMGAVAVGCRCAGATVWRTAATVVAAAALALACAAVLFAPHLFSFDSHYVAVDWAPESTRPRDLLLHFGVPLLIIGTLLVLTVPTLPGTERRRGRIAIAILAGLTVAASAGMGTLAALAGLAALVCVALVRTGRERDAGCQGAWLLVLLGLLVVGVTEVVRLPDDVGRMNTVFKFWFQAWWLLAVAAGYAAWVMWLGGSDATTAHRGLRRAWLVAVAMVVAGAALYGVGAIPARLQERFGSEQPTIDGGAYMRTATYQDVRGEYALKADWRAIEWLRRSVRGTPTVLEGVTPEYRWGGRISIYTGLPAVLGWRFHQQQQRGGDPAVERRRRDIERFYEAPWSAAGAAILRRYDVRYVVVGPLERQYHPGIASRSLAAIPWLTLRHAGGTEVYEVLREGLDQPKRVR